MPDHYSVSKISNRGRGASHGSGKSSGMATNSIIICQLFKIKDHCKMCDFWPTQDQGLHWLFLMVPWRLPAQRSIPDGLLVSLQLAKYEARLRALGAMTTQKALQEHKTEIRELLGGTQEKSVLSAEGSQICPPGESIIFLIESKQKMRQWPKPPTLMAAKLGGWSGKPHPHQSNSSYNNHSHSLLKRRVVFGILAVCVTLSRVAAQTLSEQQQQKAGSLSQSLSYESWRKKIFGSLTKLNQ